VPSVSIVIPAFNERATIEAVLERSLAVLRTCTPDYELIVMDDASTDGTWEIIERVQRAHPEIRAARHEVNRGIAATFEDLYRLATKEFVFLISGDGQFPPETLTRCAPLLADFDIVICRRTYKDYTTYRHLISSCYRWLPRVLFGVDVVDPGGVKVVKREIITTVPVHSKSVFVEAERIICAVKRGYRLTTVDMIQEARKGGEARGARLNSVVHAGMDAIACWWRMVVLRRDLTPRADRP